MKAKRIVDCMCYIAFILFMFWFAVSYVDIVIDNNYANPSHLDWNFFVLLLKGLK